MNASNETRILSSQILSSHHAVVSMPRTVWYWLDDLVRKSFPDGGYQALVRTFGQKAACPGTLSAHLRRKAQEACDARMAELYNLANDNTPKEGYQDIKFTPAHPEMPDLSARLPSVIWLFRFMPHATYLTTVWERRNYHARRRS